MGLIEDLEHFVGSGTRRSEFEGGDVRKTIEGSIGLFTGTEEISLASVFADSAKQLGSAAIQSLGTTVRKQFRKKAKNSKQTPSSLLRKGASIVISAPRKTYKSVVHSKHPTNTNTAFSRKNKHKAQIPDGSKLLRESRYSEVYRDPDGKIHVWGKPTIHPLSVLSHPYSTGREWGENFLRRANPKYRKSDPVYRDMAKIRKEYGRADHIAGYSRGGAYANMQPYSDKTEYTIHGAYTPWNEPDRRIKIRSSWKDPVHKYARAVSKNPYGRGWKHYRPYMR